MCAVQSGPVPWELSSEAFKKVIDVNLNGVFHVTRHLGAILAEQASATGPTTHTNLHHPCCPRHRPVSRAARSTRGYPQAASSAKGNVTI